MVTITPSLLEFQGPLTESSTEYIQVTNDTAEPIAFKVKTTAPKLYCVRPNSHYVQPGKTVEVSVIFLGVKEDPGPDYKCNDKFLIVTLPCPYDLKDKPAADAWPELEAEYKSYSFSRKIKVAFNQKPLQPEPQPQIELEKVKEVQPIEEEEIVELEQDQNIQQEISHSKNSNNSNNSNSAFHTSNSPTRIIIDASNANIYEKIPTPDDFPTEDKERIEMLEEKFDFNAVTKQKSGPKQPTDAPRPMTTTTVILFAFIAFIIGWLFF